jgi:hypothetical protein
MTARCSSLRMSDFIGFLAINFSSVRPHVLRHSNVEDQLRQPYGQYRFPKSSTVGPLFIPCLVILSPPSLQQDILRSSRRRDTLAHSRTSDHREVLTSSQHFEHRQLRTTNIPTCLSTFPLPLCFWLSPQLSLLLYPVRFERVNLKRIS